MKARHFIAGLCRLSLSRLSSGSPAPPAIVKHRPSDSNPAADNTDVWAWVNDGAHDKLYLVASYNPLEEPSGGPNYNEFSDDVLYEFHVTRGNKSLEDVVTYQVQFSSTSIQNVNPGDLGAPLGGGKEFFSQLTGRKQTYWLTKLTKEKNGHVKREVLGQGLPVAPVNIGPNTNKIVYNTPKYDEAFMGKYINPLGFNGNQGRVFAGQTDDGFYVDIGRIFDLANLLGGTARDNVAGFNNHSIALEIPTASLTADGQPPKAGASDDNTIGVWASASRRQVRVLQRGGGESNFGSWVQVSRLGLPLINEAVIGLQDKDKYNRTKPGKDVANFGAYFLNPVVVRDAEAVGHLQGARRTADGRRLAEARSPRHHRHDQPQGLGPQHPAQRDGRRPPRRPRPRLTLPERPPHPVRHRAEPRAGGRHRRAPLGAPVEGARSRSRTARSRTTSRSRRSSPTWRSPTRVSRKATERRLPDRWNRRRTSRVGALRTSPLHGR